MAADRRLTVPTLTMQILGQKEEKAHTGKVFEVTIYPAAAQEDAQDAGEAVPRQSAEKEILDKIRDP